MIRISVPALPVRRLQGVSKTTQKPYDLTFQTIYAHVADENGKPLPFPEKTEVTLDNGQQAYTPGDYTLSPASLYVDRNGRLAVAPKLVAIPTKA
jgi:hypothetical protein